MGKRYGRKKGTRNTLTRKYLAPNKSVIQEYGSHIRSAERGELVPATRNMEQIVQNTRTVPVYAVMPERGFQIPEERDVVNPRARVIQKIQTAQEETRLPCNQVFLRLWKSPRHQGLDVFHFTKHYHPTYGHMKLYRCALEYFWVQERENCTRISIIYSRDKALWAYERVKICFIERVSSD